MKRQKMPIQQFWHGTTNYQSGNSDQKEHNVG